MSRYRGYTETKSYGWDAAADDYIKCEGEVWFDNPAYDADFVTVGTPREGDAELLDEQLAVRDDTIAALQAECTLLRARAAELEAALETADAARAEAVAKKDAACAILCNLREVLEAVLAYRPQ